MFMKPMVWKYPDKLRQMVVFRGRVREYKGSMYRDYPCKSIRTSRGEAMKDAEKLLDELKATPTN